jgi:hypothetical protein
MLTYSAIPWAAALLLLTATQVDHASAANSSRSKLSTAAGLCQPALPVFDGLIRKRPLAVQNEGDADAFVTCAYTSDTQSSGNPGNASFVVSFINNGPENQTVSCTAVVGSTASSATYLPKVSPMILANAAAITVTSWNSTDNGGDTFGPHLPVSLSCNLPPGVGIVTLVITASVDVGD